MDLLKNLNIDKIRNAAEDVINQAKPKTEVEARIYEALSHKNWGSSSTLMNDIARDTFDYDRFNTVTRIIWESLDNPRPAAWRVVFKALTLLEHLAKNGSERCVDDARNHSHLLRALFNFNYYEGTIDRGQGVREKSKQVVELISDDERVREERNKAKQLREKFGGNLGGVSNFGGGGMVGIGGGGGGSSFSGYGRDSENYGGYGGSGSYGNSGIGSSGGYHDSAVTSESNSKNFSGRYADEEKEGATPTFAAIPDKKVKKKKKSKKKTEASDEVAPAAPEVDLLALDDPAPVEDNAFDAFHSATSPSQVDTFDVFQSNGTGQLDADSDFDAFQSANVPSTDGFNTLGTRSIESTSNTFDAFGSNIAMNNVNNAFGNMSMGASGNVAGLQQQQQQIMMGNQFSSSGMGARSSTVPSKQQQPRTIQYHHEDDDEFGDFDDGKSKKSASKDPLSNLISLDGLAKNKKKEDKTNEPIAFNDAAKTYIQNSAENSHSSGMSKVSTDIAFAGVDGLHKKHTIMSNDTSTMSGNFHAGKPVMNNGGTSVISNLDGFRSNSTNMASGMSVTNMTMMNRPMGGMSQQHVGMMGGMGQSNQGGMMNGIMSQPTGIMGDMGNNSQRGMMGGMGQSSRGGMMNNGMMSQPSGMMGGMGQSSRGGMMNNGMMSQPSGMMGGMGQSSRGGMMNNGMMSQPTGMMGSMGQSHQGGMMNNPMGGQPMGGAWQ